MNKMRAPASRLTGYAKAAGASPAGARVVGNSPCLPGHHTPFPLERSPQLPALVRPCAQLDVRVGRRIYAHQQIHADGGLTIENVNQIQVGERANVGGGSFETQHDGVSEVAAGRVKLEARVAQAAVYQDEAIAN